ncbi:DUF6602 domain-containing protein [Schlesneria paludicola]|uniref:DUF6602 domain-containing protein n=1 Tax=Schlesneria paludicola TaxID=360056 RepID=UPI00029AD657|nr:DUF6602 domain-containing protein [Schlesneria paludicola]
MPGSHLSKLRGMEFLQRAFASEQSCLVAKLRSSDRIVHDGDRGEVNEQYFIEVLRNYLPNRYTVHKATILDSDGQVSDSIDVVVHDRQYTPTLLDSESHRYIPAEAVYAVFECKPTIDKGYLEYAGKKAESVRRLKRTSVPITHAGGSYPAKPHFEILAGILAIDADWKEGFSTSFETCHSELKGLSRLDCGLAVDGHAFDTFEQGGAYTYCKSNNALVFFLFRLLNQLQSLGTVPAIDWNAYASQLSK